MKWFNIAHLRKKSKTVKNQIAFSVAGVCTALVFTVWAMSNPVGVPAIVSEDTQPGPFAGLVSQVQEQIAGVRAAITSSESDTSATTTVPGIIPDLTPAPVRQSQTETPIENQATTSQSARGVRLISSPTTATNSPNVTE